MVNNFHVFADCTMKDCKAGNCKHFLGMRVMMGDSKSYSQRIISNIRYTDILSGYIYL